MIHSLRGKLVKKQPTFVVMECAGVGFGVHVTPKDAERIGGLGTEFALHIYMHISEGDVRLYGFREEKDLEYFSMLYGVDRVGPKTAMGIVSVLSRDVFLSAVSRKDAATLLRVPGVGQKTAERILFELREKIPSAGGPVETAIESQAIEALLSLGFDRKSAEKAVSASRGAGAATLESLVTASLQKLGVSEGLR